MLTESFFLEVVQRVCPSSDLNMQSGLDELGIDSTQLLEMLIEFEIELNVDVLDDRLNLDDMHVLQDIYDYLIHLVEK